MKAPKDCENIEEVRAGIDAIDKEILALIDQRFQYVKEVVKFKTDGDIVAQKRFDEVIETRKQWAIKHGLQPEVIEKMYLIMLNYFIDEEHKLVK